MTAGRNVPPAMNICIKILGIVAHGTARFSHGVCLKTADHLCVYPVYYLPNQYTHRSL